VRKVNITIPVSLPDWLYHALRRLKRKLLSIPAQNLWGDRDVEWSFCAAHMPMGPGEALDFGNGGSYMALLAVQRGFKVTAIDIEPVQWPYVHPDLRFIQGDLFYLSLPESHFDLIINCSTVEHVGLVGRYGVKESSPDGDLKAMATLEELMKPAGIMLLTVPIGQDTVHAPWHRVYGERRLPRLLQGYIVEYQEYWVKDEANRWMLCDRERALAFKALSSKDERRNVYALGCFVLRRPL